MMLEAMEANKENQVVITSSLIALIRHQLCGPMPDIRKAYISYEKRERAAFIVAQQSALAPVTRNQVELMQVDNVAS